MNQLGKNLVYSLCVVATLLVILGVKRKLDGEAPPALLSQNSQTPDSTVAARTKNSPQPRVLQAKPTTQQDHAIVSPTSPRYTESEAELSPARRDRVFPVPVGVPSQAEVSPVLDAPDLVPVSEVNTSPTTGSVGDQDVELEADVIPRTITAAMPPRPEFVLTDSDDSFWSISEEVYGTGVYYRALFRHNESKVLRPDQLRGGIQINTPPLEVLQRQYPADFPAEADAGR